jgi:hypothetical protein
MNRHDKFFELVRYKQPCNLKFAARCKPLGLTAYGNTEEEVWGKLKQMYDILVNVTRKHVMYNLVEKDYTQEK